MSFLRKNKDAGESQQAVPAKPKRDDAPKASGGGIFSRIRNYIVDSYRGLYKVVLEPSMPTKQTIILLLLGAVIGMIWGYSINPVIFTGANPHRLNQAAQDQWVKMVAVGFDTQSRYGIEDIPTLLNQIEDPYATIQRLINESSPGSADQQALQTLLAALGTMDLSGTPMPRSAGTLSDVLGLLLPLILLLVLTPILVVVWRLLIYPNVVAGMREAIRVRRDPEYAAVRNREKAEIAALQEQKRLLVEMKKQSTADVELGQPVMQVLKVYSPGRHYDESDEIELPHDQGGDFLGQCGSSIPEVLNGDPLAIEVWLFDMQATMRKDVKKLFLTPLAASDPNIRARLSSDDLLDVHESVIVEPGAKLVLDTDTLRVQAEFVSVEIGGDGRLQNFRMKTSAWRRTGTPAFAGAVPMPQPAAAQVLSPFDEPAYSPPAPPPPVQPVVPPPPAPVGSPMPSYSPAPLRPLSPSAAQPYDAAPPSGAPAFNPPAPPPPVSGGMRYTPPPSAFSPDDDDDDDPFGKTGDFTPLGS